MRIKEGFYLQFCVDLVDYDISSPLRLDLIEKHMLVADNIVKLPFSKVSGWSVPIVRAHRQMFVK